MRANKLWAGTRMFGAPLPAIWLFVMGTIMTAHNTSRAEPAQDRSWDVSIAVPESDGERVIPLAPEAHFHVLLRNISGRDAKFWKPSNSWGYQALKFELTDSGGHKSIIQKKERSWRKNIPSFWVVRDGENVLYDVFFTSGEWEGLPKAVDGARVKMRALVEVKEDEKSREFKVWSGRAASETGDYVFR